MRFTRITPDLKDIQYLHWLANGRLAYVDWDREHKIHVLGTMTADGKDIRDHLDYIQGDVAPCPTDSNLFALVRLDRLCIYSVDTGNFVKLHRPGVYHEGDDRLIWSPDGQFLASVEVKNDNSQDTNQLTTLTIYDRQLQVVSQEISPDGFYGLSWRADSHQLAYWDVNLKTSFIGIGEPAMAPIPKVVKLSFSPAGNGYTYQKIGADHLSELMIQLIDHKPILLASFHGLGKNMPHDWLVWSPDGKFVLFNGGMFYHHILRLYSVELEKLANLVHDDSHIHFLSASWNAASTEVALLTKTGITKMIVGQTD